MRGESDGTDDSTRAAHHWTVQLSEKPPSPENRRRVAGTGAIVALVIVVAVLAILVAAPVFVVIAYLIAL
jgi:lipopolysaccharide/colanic/teichoic acid biosynthesis glycosyltransferase